MIATLAPTVAHLAAVVAALEALHPDATARIERGAQLVTAAAVERGHTPGFWWVQSACGAGQYMVIRRLPSDAPDRRDWCSCPDAEHNGGQRCKHVWATVIFEAAERLDADANAPREEENMDANAVNHLWRHDTSGEVFAVRIDSTGLIVAAAGPLHHSEHAAALAGDFDDDPELRDALVTHNGAYRRVA